MMHIKAIRLDFITLAALISVSPPGGIMANAQSKDINAKAALPALSFETEPRESKSFHRYFLSHKNGVDPNTAKADIDECLRYGMGANEAGYRAGAPIPSFVDLHTSQGHIDTGYKAHDGTYGLVGDIFVSMIDTSVNSGLGQANYRRCMGYKGYERYGLSRKDWETVSIVPHAQRVEWLAQLASGTAPLTQRLSK